MGSFNSVFQALSFELHPKCRRMNGLLKKTKILIFSKIQTPKIRAFFKKVEPVSPAASPTAAGAPVAIEPVVGVEAIVTARAAVASALVRVAAIVAENL